MINDEESTSCAPATVTTKQIAADTRSNGLCLPVFHLRHFSFCKISDVDSFFITDRSRAAESRDDAPLLHTRPSFLIQLHAYLARTKQVKCCCGLRLEQISIQLSENFTG